MLSTLFISFFIHTAYCSLSIQVISSTIYQVRHTYIHIYTYIYTYIHIYIYTYIHIHIHTYIYTYTHIYSHSTVMQRATLGKCMYLNMPTCLHTYIHTCLHTYIHIHIYIHIHTFIHTRTRDELPPSQSWHHIAKCQVPNASNRQLTRTLITLQPLGCFPPSKRHSTRLVTEHQHAKGQSQQGVFASWCGRVVLPVVATF